MAWRAGAVLMANLTTVFIHNEKSIMFIKVKSREWGTSLKFRTDDPSKKTEQLIC